MTGPLWTEQAAATLFRQRFPEAKESKESGTCAYWGCTHTHTLPLSLLFLLASQCSSKDGVKGATRSGMSGSKYIFWKVTRPHQTAAPQQVPAQRPHLPGLDRSPTPH